MNNDDLKLFLCYAEHHHLMNHPVKEVLDMYYGDIEDACNSLEESL